jgi:hypothetical protein
MLLNLTYVDSFAENLNKAIIQHLEDGGRWSDCISRLLSLLHSCTFVPCLEYSIQPQPNPNPKPQSQVQPPQGQRPRHFLDQLHNMLC